MKFQFDLTDLRLMVALAESGSVARGAESVSLSPAAASTRLKQLESRTGVGLLQRGKPPLSMTPAGLAFVQHARLILDTIGALEDAMRDMAGGVGGHVRIFAETSTVGEHLPHVLHRYLLNYPDVTIDLREKLSRDIVRAVAVGEIDIGIASGPIQTEGVEAIPYRREQLVLVVPAGHQLAREGTVEFAQALDHGHVGLYEKNTIHAFLKRTCESLNRRLQFRVQAESFETACRMIEAGIGIGVLPHSTARRHARTMALEIVPLKDEWSLRDLYICARHVASLPACVRNLVDMLREDGGGEFAFRTRRDADAAIGRRAGAPMHLDLADLRLFLSVSEADSLTGGAEALGLSLPAVSTRIKNLEETVGNKLLYRASQGITLTPPGHELARYARDIMRQIEHLNGALQAYARGVVGHLRIYANTTAVGEYLPPVLRKFLIEHPDVNVDLQECLALETIRAVSAGIADIGIIAKSCQPEGLSVIPYRRDRLVLVTPKDHELAGETAIDFERSLRYPQIGLHESSAMSAFLAQVSDAQLEALKLRIQVGSFEAACRMIESGVGVGVMPEPFARRYAAHMAIATVGLNDRWALRTHQILFRSLESLPPFARDLVDALTTDAQTATPLLATG
jgi:DNA-binding transcriptional LysR family regulator